jgi:Tol biopolymer transport system component
MIPPRHNEGDAMMPRALLLIVLSAVSLSAQAPESMQLVQVDRTGAAKTLGRLPPTTFAPRISPNGRQVVFDALAQVWIADLDNLSAPRRLAAGLYPMWSGDGTRILFIVGTGEQQMFWMAADGSGQPELLVPDARAPESWSATAQVMTYITLQGGTNYDVFAFSLRDRTSSPIATRPDALEMSSRLSPDGRWIAYESTEAGPREIFVEPFPQSGLRVRVTQGRRPVWSPDGKEIFFDREDSQLYVIPITLGSSPTVGTPTPLPIKGFLQGGGRRMYDITPDGKQFLMLFPTERGK